MFLLRHISQNFHKFCYALSRSVILYYLPIGVHISFILPFSSFFLALSFFYMYVNDSRIAANWSTKQSFSLYRGNLDLCIAFSSFFSYGYKFSVYGVFPFSLLFRFCSLYSSPITARSFAFICSFFGGGYVGATLTLSICFLAVRRHRSVCLCIISVYSLPTRTWKIV